MISIKRNASLLIVVFIMSFLLIGCSGKNESKLDSVDSVKQKVIAYLTEKGYKESDFMLKVEYHESGKGTLSGPYSISVTFNDEQDVIYYYRYNYNTENKDIQQIGTAPMTGKNDKNFKHAEDPK